jgi:hypothetical protein
MKAGTTVVAALALIALIGSGCGHPPPHPEPTSSTRGSSQNIAATSLFGDARVTAMSDSCAGRVQLAQGAATVNDSCFTGDTNIVLCTDATAANAVECAAANGKLALAGTGSDLINYARVR